MEIYDATTTWYESDYPKHIFVFGVTTIWEMMKKIIYLILDSIPNLCHFVSPAEDPVPAKMLSYNRANRAVAILCNHQRAAPKNFSKQMENIMAKIKDKRGHVKEAKQQYKQAKAAFKSEKTQKNKLYVHL